MPPTAAAVANQAAANAARRNNNNNNGLNAISFASSTSQQQHPPYFLGAPITKLLCLVWVIGSLWIVRSGGNVSKSHNANITHSAAASAAASGLLWESLITRFFFHSTSELLIGLAFLAQYMRRLERELSSRRLVVWLFTVQSVLIVSQLVALTTLDFDVAAGYMFGESVQGPYAIAGAVLYWYWMYVPRLHPRFVSLSMINMNFSEKSFGFAWAAYVLCMSGTASLLMGILGMMGSAVFFFFLLHLSFSMDVPNSIANLLPWDSIGNLLMLDSNPKVFAPLLVVQARGSAGFGGMGGRPRQPRQRRQAPPPAAAAAPPLPPPAEAVAQLTAMGFEEQRVKEALQVSGNNIERAANILLTG
ncbi:MAG: hypothetical protein SGILL_000374 [Bacillariaceae sp.]